MKIDIRQITDLFDTCGYLLIEKGKPQSTANWNVDSACEFESEFKKVSVSFTIDPTDGYLSSMNPARNKKKLPAALDTAQIVIISKESGESIKHLLNLRNSKPEDISQLKRLLTFV